ncbi:DUF1538 domain-containing protein [Anaerosalibacter massiliensis]|uniref:DUF1538 domain-containing protein n=1 Tax=Anaerosalibacter massiliensis TaxID=1347392 RepID=A0A9X2S414_9FIRM|nr:DUF1538 domain-containing protein [Anaerosalibacter massiliensis]MCR2043018.1 DUF1538 domain-containing protein [Anaerosalibacter massiliensis]
MSVLINKFKEVSLSVLPITLIVIILNFTVVPIKTEMLIRFIIGAIFVIIGLGIFLFGAEIGIGPIGNLMGETIAKTNKSYLVGLLGFVLGFLITVAEPDLQILARQVNNATGGIVSGSLILIIVSIGVGVMVAIGLLRILYEKPLNKLFTIVYSILLLLGICVSEEFLAISVDASGATTGAMTTPFILALGLGVSQLKGGKTSEEDSFGLVGIASTGPILAVMIMNIITGTNNIQGQAEVFVPYTGIFTPYLQELPKLMRESIITLLPIFILFLIFNLIKFKLSKKNRNKILKGLIYTYIGLVLFLSGVNAGFMEVGRVMGHGIANLESSWMLPTIGFILGMVVVLAEPAVYVLTEQVEDVTSGHIRKNMILGTLSLGIAFAVTISMLRIMIPNLKLWHFLLPGFGLATFLSYKVPPIFVGIAYDSGGVASGPMTATFILAFAQGAANAIPTANVLIDGFGVIAMVAMTPLVAIQILGLLFKIKANKGGADLDEFNE